MVALTPNGMILRSLLVAIRLVIALTVKYQSAFEAH